MKSIWFKKIGWFYIPTTVLGGLLTLATFAFCVNVFIIIDRNSHSGSDTLYAVFPYIISSFTVLFWIASNTSKE